MKTKILIIGALLGFSVMAQSNISIDDFDEKIIEVNFTQRNALVTANLICSSDEIEILNNSPYLIYKGKPGRDCCKENDEKLETL